MNKQLLLETHSRISPYIHKTPVLESRLINKIAGAEIHFKCENFQRMGAYKIRGATNAILQLSASARSCGVVTHSSGNFAQALALAADNLGVKAYIVMPSSAPGIKVKAVEEYGGKIFICDPTLAAREAASEEIQRDTGAIFIHPSNDEDVILGQGTAALELLEEVPDIDAVITPVGGGGLLAGSALAAHFFGKHCRVYGGEPFEADDAYRSMISGKIEGNISTNTIADGLKTVLGDKNFPIIQKYVDEIIRVTEDEIISAMHLIWERMKIIIEPSSAVALAAVLREKEKFSSKKIGIVISGGNVDLEQLPF
ncbi:MAG: pyridoxal-phosphate dependent enzyme [Eudoraea sp.]|nr:pyridoxal-phosphate dependent enzyme [Eudoraea sp.]